MSALLGSAQDSSDVTCAHADNACDVSGAAALWDIRGESPALLYIECAVSSRGALCDPRGLDGLGLDGLGRASSAVPVRSTAGLNLP